MTIRRSEPKTDCRICRGTGVVSVSKDPDVEDDCACTDPVEMTVGERVDAFAKTLGIELMPWQRELTERLLLGERVVRVGGRRAGMKTVARVAEGARYV